MRDVLVRSKAVLFDLDGTLIRGEEAIPGAASFVHELVNLGKRIVYLTNNATRTKQAVATLLAGLGFPATPDMVLTSSVTAAALLTRKIGTGKNVYVIGEEGLRQPLVAAGFVLEEADDASVAAVVMGLDRQVTYLHFEKAVQHIYAGAVFMVTNMDRVIPVRNGFAPGAGSLVALVKTATGVNPIIAGKPSEAFVNEALRLAGVKREEAILIGDNPDTDILAAKNAGVFSILIESGVPSDENIFPDLQVHNLADLLN
jgi:4-nitrophenyl phosphatase